MNQIIIELCAEDRARLDKIIAALEQGAESPAPTEAKTEDKPTTPKAKSKTKTSKPTEAAGEPTEAAEEPTPTTDTPEEEKKPAEAPAAAPTVTLEQIQQKVVQLAAGFDGAKKAQVRGIINDYGAKVSDLKDQPEKWDEVWGRLTALESEG